MIHEIASIEVIPGMETEFEQGVREAAPLFKRAQGCRSMTLQREIERPNHYRLYVTWESLEDHTVRFRGSEDFTAWRALVGKFFAAPPSVSHVETTFQPF